MRILARGFSCYHPTGLQPRHRRSFDIWRRDARSDTLLFEEVWRLRLSATLYAQPLA